MPQEVSNHEEVVLAVVNERSYERQGEYHNLPCLGKFDIGMGGYTIQALQSNRFVKSHEPYA